MARLRLLTQRLLAGLLLAGAGHVWVHAEADGLDRVNDALAAWIDAIDSDRPFLLFDGNTAELRLQHGTAILRIAPLQAGSIASGQPVRQRLQARLRQYGAVPFQPIRPGPFDWEQYLARAADDDCALLFAGGLLIHSHDKWAAGDDPANRLRLAPDDLRALFDAVADSIELVLLPAGWNTRPDGSG